MTKLKIKVVHAFLNLLARIVGLFVVDKLTEKGYSRMQMHEELNSAWARTVEKHEANWISNYFKSRVRATIDSKVL